MGLVVMDLEIKEAVDESNPERGWAAARSGKLGVSVVCVYDYETDRYHFFDDYNLGEGIALLESADGLVSFNGLEFDLPCLSGVYGRSIMPRGHYDILQQVWKALGRRTKGYGLGPICERTLGVGKAGSGIGATDLWNENRVAELYTYCLADVHLTSVLFDHIMTTGHIIDINGDVLHVYNKDFPDVGGVEDDRRHGEGDLPARVSTIQGGDPTSAAQDHRGVGDGNGDQHTGDRPPQAARL